MTNINNRSQLAARIELSNQSFDKISLGFASNQAHEILTPSETMILRDLVQEVRNRRAMKNLYEIDQIEMIDNPITRLEAGLTRLRCKPEFIQIMTKVG